MFLKEANLPLSPYFNEFARLYRIDESDIVEELLRKTTQTPEQHQNTQKRATLFVEAARKAREGKSGIDAFLSEYSLSSQEGAVLMCLAESLLRIPDTDTAEKLIRDKLSTANWDLHRGKSDSTFVNFSTWALMFSGKVLNLTENVKANPWSVLKKLIGKTGEPVIRTALYRGVRIMGKQFVMGETIESAVKRAQPNEKIGYRYSYDMLGESAKTMKDAERYFNSYTMAIEAIQKASNGKGIFEGPGLSVKVSALHPRYEFAQRDRSLKEIFPKLLHLAQNAKAGNIGLTIDAEEADRLELSLELINMVSAHPSLKDWDGLGLAVQAYQKRAGAVLDYLSECGEKHHRRFMVRLVKGAYWDAEIKRAQERGFESYPVFTRKSSTDLSYFHCAQKLLSNNKHFYPQFATHNAQTAAWIIEHAKNNKNFEFQRLHGMGEELYDEIVPAQKLGIPCRVYAPVGGYEELLSYLVRRLLENGANTSFVNRLADETTPIDQIIQDPIERTKKLISYPHPHLPIPHDIYPDRPNSKGFDISDPQVLLDLSTQIKNIDYHWECKPIIGDIAINIDECRKEGRFNPTNTQEKIGIVYNAGTELAEKAIEIANVHYEEWDKVGGQKRGDILQKVADLIEENAPSFIAYCIKEAGKTLNDAIAEIREAADFCRYYGSLAQKHFETPLNLQGVTGETNHLSLHGRGVFLCISPWNFPLAIFTGQIAASLAAGNAVLAKPAQQTPLIAHLAVTLFHQAGVPKEVLHLVPGKGSEIGQFLIEHPKIAGVCFTGSTETAWHINQSLAKKRGTIVPFIAETGGQNVMIIDSSALPEQVVNDIITSSFQSAGQRCSALRVAFIQDDIADKVIDMLKGAMDELDIGDTRHLKTDIGPVIDANAQKTLLEHAEKMTQTAKLIHKATLSPDCVKGHFVAPHAFEISDLSVLEKEVFGPILHIIRFKSDQLPNVVESINKTGYGLTLGIQTRIQTTMDYIRDHAKVGNMYVNRNMIGAVVGVQPFGGEGLSGTGPKAGGPHALFRHATERTYTVNTTAIGGNTSLVTMNEDD